MLRRNRRSGRPGAKRSHTRGAKSARNRPGASSQEYMDKQVKKLQGELAIKAAKYEVKAYLKIAQKGRCANCGKPLDGEADPHHRLIRRQPDSPDLYNEHNISLICRECHTPEAPDLGYNTTLFAFRMGITTPEKTEAWHMAYCATRKCGLPLPEFYWRAKEEYERTSPVV